MSTYKKIQLSALILALLGAGCTYPPDNSPQTAPTSASTESTTAGEAARVSPPQIALPTPSATNEGRRPLNWYTTLKDQKNPDRNWGINAVNGCIYLDNINEETAYSKYSVNLFDLLADQKPISESFPLLDTGDYTLKELTAVNKTAQDYSQTTAGGELQAYITCKLFSRTQGPVYLVMGTYAITSKPKDRVQTLERNQEHMARYANRPGKSFLVIIPQTNKLIVRRNVTGATVVSPVGREDLGPCSGELIQEYQLMWSCGLGYVKNKDGTHSLRTRTWLIRLFSPDPRPDMSFITEKNVGTEEKDGPFFFYRYQGFEKDTESLEWTGNEWKVTSSTSSS